MIVLYSVLLSFLNSLRYLTARRAKSLERKYTRLALATGKLAQQPVTRPGNNRSDLCQTARQQYELGQLVLKRDRLEAKHFAWQLRLERLTKRVKAMQGWKGRKLPYLLGVMDVALALGALDHFDLARVDLSQLHQLLHNLLAR